MSNLPPFTENGRLPRGIHKATWREVNERFAFNAHRAGLLDGLRAAIRSLALAGCRAVYLDGSFVTSEDTPADWDACWDPTGVDVEAINPALLDTSPGGIFNQKLWFLGEMYPATTLASGGATFLEFFQLSKHDDNGKGIVVIDPAEVE